MATERITGWKAIAEYFGVSRASIMRRRAELDAEGVIFYVCEGRPPHRVACSFPNLLQAFVVKKGKL